MPEGCHPPVHAERGSVTCKLTGGAIAVDDLLFSSKIRETAKQAGVEISRAVGAGIRIRRAR